MACAKLVSHLRPPRDLNVGRAKHFAQFRIAKVSHFARHTDFCVELQISFNSDDDIFVCAASLLRQEKLRHLVLASGIHPNRAYAQVCHAKVIAQAWLAA